MARCRKQSDVEGLLLSSMYIKIYIYIYITRTRLEYDTKYMVSSEKRFLAIDPQQPRRERKAYEQMLVLRGAPVTQDQAVAHTYAEVVSARTFLSG